MSRSVLGYTLIAVAVVGIVASFGTLDLSGAIGMQRYGIAWGLSNALVLGTLPLGLTVAALLALGLVGLGLVVFPNTQTGDLKTSEPGEGASGR